MEIKLKKNSNVVVIFADIAAANTALKFYQDEFPKDVWELKSKEKA